MLKRQIKTLIYTFLVLTVVVVFVAEEAFAFTAMSIENLNKELQKILKQHKQENKKVAIPLQKTLENLTKIYTEKNTQEELKEAISRLRCFINKGKTLYNTQLRSRLNTQTGVVTTLSNEITNYLPYLDDMVNTYVLFSKQKFKNIVSQVKEQQTTSDKKQVSNRGTSLKIISTENHLHATLKKYVFWGLLFWIASFFLYLWLLNWKVNLHNVLAFIFYSIAIALVVLVVCYLVYFIWKNIILPIISAIMTIIGWLLVLTGGGVSSHNRDEGETVGGLCSHSNRDYCEGCPEINPYNRKYIDSYTDLQWCKDRCCYIDPEKSPSENISG